MDNTRLFLGNLDSVKGFHVLVQALVGQYALGHHDGQRDVQPPHHVIPQAPARQGDPARESARLGEPYFPGHREAHVVLPPPSSAPSLTAKWFSSASKIKDGLF